MKSARPFLFAAAIVVALAYLVFSTRPSSIHSLPGVGRLDKDLLLGEAIAFRNLAIYPVTSQTPRLDDRFITLDEGLKAGTIEILEKGAMPSHHNSAPTVVAEGTDPFAPSASRERLETASEATDPFGAGPAENTAVASRQLPSADPFAEPAAVQQSSQLADGALVQANAVNELLVINHSEKPLYLMPGEIIVGGSQDRTIGQELVVAPDHKPVAIGVFCVERGRWGGRDLQAYASLVEAAAGSNGIAFSGANLSLDLGETAAMANSGKFIGSVGSLNKQGRITVQGGEGQLKVWEEVASENAKNQVQPPTGTFTSNYSDAGSVERLSPYVNQLLKPIEEMENIVGVVIAVNGRMESLDVFESTPLFRKLWPKLLKSYALDAANAEGTSEEVGKTATREEALRFFHDVAQARADNANASGEIAVIAGENDRVQHFSFHDRRNVEGGGLPLGSMGGVGMGGMGGAAFGGAIHSSGFSK